MNINLNTTGTKNSNPQVPFYQTTETSWNQWLAGVIDGDGYLSIQTSNNVAVCEITMPLEDEALLFKIKQKLGGSIKSRSGAKAVRYRLCHQNGMVDLLHRINGSIRNSLRIVQFKRLCEKFSIDYLQPGLLTLENGYIAGFFDADGTILISVDKTSQPDSILPGTHGKITRLTNSRGFHQLRIEIANKYAEDLIFFQTAFGSGSIRAVTVRKKHQTHIYRISDIDAFIYYVSKYPLHSVKMKRVFALKSYFELKRIKAHLADKPSIKNKAWATFCKKWYNF